MTAPQPATAAGPSRFEWERAIRRTTMPRHLKFFLLLLGTYMNHDGSRCFPTAKEMGEVGGWSRQRVFELFREASAAGWIVDQKRSGHATVRVPAIPPAPVDNPHHTDLQHTTPAPVNPSDPSDQGGQTHLTPPSDPSDPTVTRQNQDSHGGTLPPRTPPANPAADATGNEHQPHDPQWPTDQPDLAKQPDTRARANDCPTCATVLDPDGSCFICHTPAVAYTGT